MFTAQTQIPLTAAAREIKIRYDRVVSYRQLYLLILDGRLPAVQIKGRYRIEIDDIAEVLGLATVAV
jgi:hypothetical protein